MPKSHFTYQARTAEDVKARANARGGDFDDYIKPEFKKYKVRDGKNLIRILPPTWPKARHYGYDIYVNYGVGADNQAYLSLSKMKGEKDPLAEARHDAEQADDEKLSKALRPNKRILVWLIDRKNEEEGPQLWAMPFTVDKAFAAIATDPDTGAVVYVDDHAKGHDISFEKEGTGLTTKYDGAKMRLKAPSVLSEDDQLMDDWLEYIQANPLPNVLNFYSYDHISQVFNGKARTDDEAAPAPRRAKPVSDDYVPTRQTKANGEDEDTPKPRRRVVEQDEDELPSRRSRTRVEAAPEDEDAEAGVGASIRERLKRARAPVQPAEDED